MQPTLVRLYLEANIDENTRGQVDDHEGYENQQNGLNQTLLGLDFVAPHIAQFEVLHDVAERAVLGEFQLIVRLRSPRDSEQLVERSHCVVLGVENQADGNRGDEVYQKKPPDVLNGDLLAVGNVSPVGVVESYVELNEYVDHEETVDDGFNDVDALMGNAQDQEERHEDDEVEEKEQREGVPEQKESVVRIEDEVMADVLDLLDLRLLSQVQALAVDEPLYLLLGFHVGIPVGLSSAVFSNAQKNLVHFVAEEKMDAEIADFPAKDLLLVEVLQVDQGLDFVSQNSLSSQFNYTRMLLVSKASIGVGWEF